MCCQNFKIINPINNFISTIKYWKKQNIGEFKDIILKLVYYGHNLNNESHTFLIEAKIFTKEEINEINKTANELYKPKEIIIKKKKVKGKIV
jgi:hypothetical protein